jgi:cell division protein FtsI (penicillin-binding protein 3)
MLPATRPRLVCVVVINEPSHGKYYGGLVAAPVFAHVMAGAMRILDIPPDNLDTTAGTVVINAGGGAP